MMLHREPRSAPAATTTADMEIHLAEFYPRLASAATTAENDYHLQGRCWQGVGIRLEFAFRGEGNALDCVRPDTAAVATAA